jgi:E3 ubiquitin-protein ligase MARCH1/8
MSGVERRRLFCAVLFHLAAALCVIWSLCVLIERSAEEVRMGKLGWPFWTKLVVVTVGLTGGIVFMYIQCKQYLNLCSRWRSRNRILLIQNAPEKVAPNQSSHSPLRLQNSHQSSVEPSTSLRRNNSSVLVITAPLNNVMEINEHQNHLYDSAQSRQQSQIVANIENNSMNYELDDDISYSQISFKQHLRHCDEGTSSRGSLHNVYDNTSVSTTNTSATTRNLTTAGDNDSNFLRMYPGLEEVKEHMDGGGSGGGGGGDRRNMITNKNKMGTSIFIENNDILNDQNYPTLSHRHSTYVLSSAVNSSDVDEIESSNKFQKERRRYSDTKLLNCCNFENEFLINKSGVFGSPTKNDTKDELL